MKRVYFNEFNLPMNGTVYLPLVSGMLRAYAETFPVLKESFEFMPFLFIRDLPEKIVEKYVNPSVAAFSVCIWNHQLSLKVARMVKKKFPSCQIVFGGPQVEANDKEKYPFIDHIILEEGEKKWVKLLGSFIGQDIACEHHGIDDFPSPYHKNLYNYVFTEYPDYTFQAIVETNRGCPFTCDFCYWGQGFSEKKVRHHSLTYVREEAEWIGRNRIKYVFMADANFGMYERDLQVAQIYADVHEEMYYPQKVRVCYGKNKEENVFKTAKLMSDSGIAKAVTLARQSNDADVLKNIRRANIKLGVYTSLQERYHNAGIPTYTEIILGLPGETVESFKKGVSEIMGSATQLFIYHCSILPNTEMAKEDYIRRHGIKTVRVPLAEIHCSVRKPEDVVEYEDIVIQTATMTKEEWIEMCVFSWEMQLKQTFDTDCTPMERNRFYQIAENITNGYSRGQVDARFGGIYWEPEEMAYLRIKLQEGAITGDLEAFARDVVLFGRKSRVHQPPLGV